MHSNINNITIDNIIFSRARRFVMKSSKKVLIMAASMLLLVGCASSKPEVSSSNPIDSQESTPSSVMSDSSSKEETSSSSLPESSSSTSSTSSSSSSSSANTSSSRRPIGGNSSSSSSSSSTPSSSSSKTSSSSSVIVDSSDDIPILRKITMHADAANEGLTVTAPNGSYANKTVELTVTLSEGYILEYIRLYAPTTADGGVRVNPNAEGKYVFTMPDKNVDIYYKGVKGYKVSFAGTHATAELGAEGGKYCYCNVTGYTPDGGTLQSLSSSWVFNYDNYDGIVMFLSRSEIQR